MTGVTLPNTVTSSMRRYRPARAADSCLPQKGLTRNLGIQPRLNPKRSAGFSSTTSPFKRPFARRRMHQGKAPGESLPGGRGARARARAQIGERWRWSSLLRSLCSTPPLQLGSLCSTPSLQLGSLCSTPPLQLGSLSTPTARFSMYHPTPTAGLSL